MFHESFMSEVFTFRARLPYSYMDPPNVMVGITRLRRGGKLFMRMDGDGGDLSLRRGDRNRLRRRRATMPSMARSAQTGKWRTFARGLRDDPTGYRGLKVYRIF